MFYVVSFLKSTNFACFVCMRKCRGRLVLSRQHISRLHINLLISVVLQNDIALLAQSISPGKQ